MSEALIPEHGGYRKLKSFQVAQLVWRRRIRTSYIEVSGDSFIVHR
jgi:hypothetical protein